MLSLTQFLGDSTTHRIPLAYEGEVFDPTGYRLIWTAKRSATDPDTSAVIQKMTSGLGITTAEVSGVWFADVSTVHPDTRDLTDKYLAWDVQAEDLSTGQVYTVAIGTLALARDVTRQTFSSIPINTTEPGAGLGDMTKAVYDPNDDGIVEAADYAATAPWAGLTGKPLTFPPSAHTHVISDVTGLTVALSNKEDAGTAASLLAAHVAADDPHGDRAFSIQRANHTGVQQPTTIVNDAAHRWFTDAEATKLDGIEDGATANQTDAFLLARGNHTGTQAIATVDGLQTALDGKDPAGSAAAVQAFAVQRANHTGTQAISTVEDLQDTLDLKENAGVAAGLLAMHVAAADPHGDRAFSIQRANHTGTQAISTVSGLQTALDGKETAGAAAAAQAYSIQRANHTGTQAISTVSGLQTALDTLEANRQNIDHGVFTQPAVTDNGNGTISLAAGGLVNLHTDADGTSGLFRYTLPAAGPLSLTDGTTNYIVASSTGYTVSTSQAVLVDRRLAVVYQIYRTGTGLHTLTYGPYANDTASRLLIRTIQSDKFRKITGLVISETATRIVNVSAGSVYFGVAIQALAASVSNVNQMYLYTRTGGVWSGAIVTQYNNIQWNNGTNTVTLSNGRYAVNWIYRGVESQNHTYVVLGNGDYTLSQAQASQPDGLPDIISSHAILVGRIIVQKNASTATQIDQVATIAFTGSAVYNHNDLANIQGGAAGDYNHLTTTQVGYVDDVPNKAPLASPALTGTPTAPTAAISTNSTQLATTAFVQERRRDLLSSRAAQQGLVFVGTSQCTGTLASAIGTSDFTVNIRIKVPSAAVTKPLLLTGPQAVTGVFRITLVSDNSLIVYGYESGSDYLTATVANFFTNFGGRFVDLTVTRSSSTGLAVYVNTAAQTVTTGSAGAPTYTWANIPFTTTALTYGGNSSAYFDGFLGPLDILTRALSANEVSSLLLDGAPRGSNILLSLNRNTVGNGYQWGDVSGNNSNLTIPATGVSWALPSRHGKVLRATTSTNGNQQILGQQALPLNCRITSWTVYASGNVTISLGSASGGAQYVSGLAVTGSTLTAITLLTPFSTSGNLWCNSNGTSTIKHVITYELLDV
jgi:hypothetical protein